MRKKFYIFVLILISAFAIFLVAIPYVFDVRTKDYSSDLAFETRPSIEEVNLLYDYSNSQEIDQSLLGRISLNYKFKTTKSNRAVLPFYAVLNQNHESYQTMSGKDFEVFADGEELSYQTLYGDDSLNSDLSRYNFEDLKKVIYEAKSDNSKYYVYTFNLNGQRLGIDHYAVNYNALITINLKVSNLTKKELRELENTEFYNKAVLVPTDATSIIVSRVELDDYFTIVQEKTELNGSKELYSYLFRNYNVDFEDVSLVAENEIAPLFENNGFNSLSLDDFVNKQRLMLFEFEVPQDINELSISYNNVSGMDSRYETPQYEVEFHYNRKNYEDTTSFNITYKLDDKNKNINFTVFELEKNGNSYSRHFEELPLEVKIYFSASVESKKTIDTLKIELSGFSKYIILPFLLIVLVIALIMDIINRISKKQEEKVFGLKYIFQFLKDKIVNYFPEILTFYMLGFKFYTLYTGDSSLNITNAIILIIFIFACFIYFVCKTMNSVNYLKLLFYTILACFVGFVVEDLAFIMLIALGVCFADKGPKPFLKALYLSIIFFSLQTIIFSAFGIIKDEIFHVWNMETWEILDFERHSLGFSHPNTVSLFLFVGYLSLMLYKKTSFWERIGLILLTVVIYYLTRSRTGCLCVVILLILDILSDVFKFKGKWRYIIVPMFPVLTILTYLAAKNYTNFQSINYLLSGRLSIIFTYLEKDWLTIFGASGISSSLYELVPIDNLYMNVLIFQGLPCYLIYLLIYVIASYKAAKTNNAKMFFGLLIYFVFSLTEATLMSYSCAIFVALLFITTLGDKYYMDGRLIERKPRTSYRVLYIVKSLEGLVFDETCSNVVFVVGSQKGVEYINQTKVVYVNRWNILKQLSEYIKYFDPDDIHFYYPNKLGSFALLSMVFKGNLILHIDNEYKSTSSWKAHKGRLMAKASRVVEV